MRYLSLAAAAAAAGAVTAHAVAPLSATFTATAVGNATTYACTTATGKTIAFTHATYTGRASGAPDLTGSASIAARSTIDTTDDVGFVTGTLKIGKTHASFSAVYDHGALAGLATGNGGHLFANLSARFRPTAGFTSGRIGRTSGGSAVELSLGSCQSSSAPHTPLNVEGRVTAVSPSSITVAGLTCAVPRSLGLPVFINFHVGGRASIRCALVNGAKTLVKIEPRH